MMWHYREIVDHEPLEFDLVPCEVVPIGSARPEQAPADTRSPIEREAFEWLVSQLRFQRTLEMLRTCGPAKEHQPRAGA